MRKSIVIPFDAEPPLPDAVSPPPPDLGLPKRGRLWVFGYGSLMWDPGFEFQCMRPAMLYGYHRAFCVWSHHYRGTVARPGLVLGLSPGGSCRGLAFRVSADHRDAVVDYLYRREMLTGVYVPRLLRVLVPEGVVTALAFTADRDHGQFAGRLTEAKTAAVIAGAHGRRGPNRDYLAQTVRHLDELGIKDGALHRLLARVVARKPG